MRITISILRALCAMLVGFLLLSNPEDMTPLLLQIIGGLFGVMGLITLVSHYVNRYRFLKAQRRAAAAGLDVLDIQPFSPVTPFVALGSIAFGALLIVFPQYFVMALMYVLGALLILFGVVQAVGLIRFRHIAPLGWSLLLFPLLLVGAGAFVVTRPMQAAALPFIVLGAAFIVYGVAEFCLGIRYYHYRRIFDARMAEAEEIVEEEETPSSLPLQGEGEMGTESQTSGLQKNA